MNTLTRTVTGMSCMGCVNSVKSLVGALPCIVDCNVDLASGRVEVTHDPVLAAPDAIRSVINDAGYRVNP